MVLFSHTSDETQMDFAVLPTLRIHVDGGRHTDKLVTTNEPLKKLLVQQQSRCVLSDRFLKEETPLLDKYSYDKLANLVHVELSYSDSVRKVLITADECCDFLQSGNSCYQNTDAYPSDLLAAHTLPSHLSDCRDALFVNIASTINSISQALPCTHSELDACTAISSNWQEVGSKLSFQASPRLSSLAYGRLNKALPFKISRKRVTGYKDDDGLLSKKCHIPITVTSDGSKEVTPSFQTNVTKIPQTQPLQASVPENASAWPITITEVAVHTPLLLSIDLNKDGILEISNNLVKAMPPVTFRGDPRLRAAVSDKIELDKSAACQSSEEFKKKQHGKNVCLSSDSSNRRGKFDDNIDMCEQAHYLLKNTVLPQPVSLHTKRRDKIPGRLETWKMLDAAYEHSKQPAKLSATKITKSKSLRYAELKTISEGMKTDDECQSSDAKCNKINEESKKPNENSSKARALSFHGKPLLSCKVSPTAIPLQKPSDHIVDPSEPRMFPRVKSHSFDMKLPYFATPRVSISKFTDYNTDSHVPQANKSEHVSAVVLQGTKSKPVPHYDEKGMERTSLFDKFKLFMENLIAEGSSLPTLAPVQITSRAAFDPNVGTSGIPRTPSPVEIQYSGGNDDTVPADVKLPFSDDSEQLLSMAIACKSLNKKITDFNATAFKGPLTPPTLYVPCSEGSDYDVPSEVTMPCFDIPVQITSSAAFDPNDGTFRRPCTPPSVKMQYSGGNDYTVPAKVELPFSDESEQLLSVAIACKSLNKKTTDFNATAFKGPLTPPTLYVPCSEGSDYYVPSEVTMPLSDIPVQITSSAAFDPNDGTFRRPCTTPPVKMQYSEGSDYDVPSEVTMPHSDIPVQITSSAAFDPNDGTFRRPCTPPSVKMQYSGGNDYTVPAKVELPFSDESEQLLSVAIACKSLNKKTTDFNATAFKGSLTPPTLYVPCSEGSDYDVQSEVTMPCFDIPVQITSSAAFDSNIVTFRKPCAPPPVTMQFSEGNDYTVPAELKLPFPDDSEQLLSVAIACKSLNKKTTDFNATAFKGPLTPPTLYVPCSDGSDCAVPSEVTMPRSDIPVLITSSAKCNPDVRTFRRPCTSSAIKIQYSEGSDYDIPSKVTMPCSDIPVQITSSATFDPNVGTFRKPCTPPPVTMQFSEGNDYTVPAELKLPFTDDGEQLLSVAIACKSLNKKTNGFNATAFKGPLTPPTLYVPCSEGSDYDVPSEVTMPCSDFPVQVTSSAEFDPNVGTFRKPCTSPPVNMQYSEGSDYDVPSEVTMPCSDIPVQITSSATFDPNVGTFRKPCTPPPVTMQFSEGTDHTVPAELKLPFSDDSEQLLSVAIACKSLNKKTNGFNATAFKGPLTPPTLYVPCSEGSDYDVPSEVTMPCSDSPVQVTSSAEFDPNVGTFRKPCTSPPVNMQYSEGSDYDVPSEVTMPRSDIPVLITDSATFNPDVRTFRRSCTSSSIKIQYSEGSDYDVPSEVTMPCSDIPVQITSSATFDPNVGTFRKPCTPPPVTMQFSEGNDYSVPAEVKLPLSDDSEQSLSVATASKSPGKEVPDLNSTAFKCPLTPPTFYVPYSGGTDFDVPYEIAMPCSDKFKRSNGSMAILCRSSESEVIDIIAPVPRGPHSLPSVEVYDYSMTPAVNVHLSEDNKQFPAATIVSCSSEMLSIAFPKEQIASYLWSKSALTDALTLRDPYTQPAIELPSTEGILCSSSEVQVAENSYSPREPNVKCIFESPPDHDGVCEGMEAGVVQEFMQINSPIERVNDKEKQESVLVKSSPALPLGTQIGVLIGLRDNRPPTFPCDVSLSEGEIEDSDEDHSEAMAVTSTTIAHSLESKCRIESMQTRELIEVSDETCQAVSLQINSLWSDMERTRVVIWEKPGYNRADFDLDLKNFQTKLLQIKDEYFVRAMKHSEVDMAADARLVIDQCKSVESVIDLTIDVDNESRGGFVSLAKCSDFCHSRLAVVKNMSANNNEDESPSCEGHFRSKSNLQSISSAEDQNSSSSSANQSGLRQKRGKKSKHTRHHCKAI